MAEVGLAFLSASLTVLFERITSSEVLHFLQGSKTTEVLLRKLKNAMLSVKVVLEDAEEKQLTDSSVKEWVDELKDVLYDAEDILDEIATEALQSKLQVDAESTTFVEHIRNSVSALVLEPFSEKAVDEKIEEVLVRLEDLAKQKDCMGLQVLGVGGKQADPERLTTSYVSESDTFGRDEDKKKVIDLLILSDAGDNEISCVIAIVGMGGIGKTTLAQLVYNESSVKQHFDLRIWFCVSEEFVLPNVMKSIIDQAATSSACDTKDPEKLRDTVQKNLNGQKFLLVLDDIWSEKPIHREFLSQLLHYGTRGSKILVTTRNQSVALAMKAIATHHPKLLLKDDCWSLFEKHAFRDGSSNADPKIKDIGRQIVDKCKGLPLAIKAFGDLLWSESSVERWTIILKSNLWDLHMEGTNILPTLRLSYKYLPSYLKRCFAYCSIFPKDHIFKKDELVLLWMAEGFLQQSERETMEEVGKRYFDALISRSLFQQSSLTYSSSFVMHDLVNDLANFVTGQFGTDGFKKVVKMTRYISYSNKHWRGFEDIEEDLLKAKQLRTFLALRDFPKATLIMPLCLRVLSFKLPDSIGQMKYLRYLDVSGAEFNRLPDSLCNLCNLQTLKLSRCRKLDRLPRDMWKLVNLRHLEIDVTDALKEMPIQMGRLKCLQTLSKFIVSKNDDSGCRIGELGNLKNLRGQLLIEELQNVRSANDASDASLKDMGYLEKLALKWDPPNPYFRKVVLHEPYPPNEVLGILESQRGVLSILESQRGVLENLQPHENLKSLSIIYYDGKGFPDWIGGLTSLSELELIGCKYCSALPPLGHLPFLNKLKIYGLDGVVTIGPEFYGNSSNFSMKPFRRLKFLRMENMSNLENWFDLGTENEVETFSQLEVLVITDCLKLRGRLPVHLPSLAKLEIRYCQHLEDPLSIDSFPVLTRTEIEHCDTLESLALPEQQKHEGITDFRNCIQELRISWCSSLVSLPREGLLSTLKRLEIDYCKKLELPMHDRQYSSLKVLMLRNCCDSLTSISLDPFPNLKHIQIDGCNNLNSLKQHGDHVVISSIAIWNCPMFVDFPKGGLLPSLCYLALRDCPEIESFPEGGLPSNLRHIVIWNCKKLIKNRKGWGLQTLPSLEWLEIRGFESLEDHMGSFPGELLLPTTLTHLKISLCKKLDEGFQHLTSLVQLEIVDCRMCRYYMPEEGFPGSLRILWMSNICPMMEKELKSKEGEQWLKVAHIPNIAIGVHRITEWDRRLVTIQGDGDDGWPDCSPYEPHDYFS